MTAARPDGRAVWIALDALRVDPAFKKILRLPKRAIVRRTPPSCKPMAIGCLASTCRGDYGPARALAPPLVAEIAMKLASLSDAELRSRFNGPAMIAKKIYPEIWDRDPAEDDSLGYLIENLAGLRKAVADAARRRQGLVLALT
jgi:hypothetical protein